MKLIFWILLIGSSIGVGYTVNSEFFWWGLFSFAVFSFANGFLNYVAGYEKAQKEKH